MLDRSDKRISYSFVKSLGKNIPLQVNSDSKRFYQITWNVMEAVQKLVSSTVFVTFWSEKNKITSNFLRKLKGADLTKAQLFCKVIFDANEKL